MTIHIFSGSRCISTGNRISVRCSLRPPRMLQYYRLPITQANFITSNSGVMMPGQWHIPSCATLDSSSSCARVSIAPTKHMIHCSNYNDLHRNKSRSLGILTNTTSNICINNNKISRKRTNSFGATRRMNTDNSIKHNHPSSSSSMFHFATTDYADSFMMTTMVNQRLKNNNESNKALRQQALHYLNQTYDPTLWFNDPVCIVCLYHS